MFCGFWHIHIHTHTAIWKHSSNPDMLNQLIQCHSSETLSSCLPNTFLLRSCLKASEDQTSNRPKAKSSYSKVWPAHCAAYGSCLLSFVAVTILVVLVTVPLCAMTAIVFSHQERWVQHSVCIWICWRTSLWDVAWETSRLCTCMTESKGDAAAENLCALIHCSPGLCILHEDTLIHFCLRAWHWLWASANQRAN